MIGFINGRVDHIGSNFCLVEAQGVGYRIFMNASDLGRMVLDQKIKIYTYLSVREDALQLYGFLSYDVYSLFTKLITVSGIGPKVALNVLSAAKPDAFFMAIRNRDIKYLTKLPALARKRPNGCSLSSRILSVLKPARQEGTMALILCRLTIPRWEKLWKPWLPWDIRKMKFPQS